ncbi:cupin domain-containing protein [Defluviimonas salinarum]|uniref:Cupin domain-containing protein n=1 Tax=Defluviimonas salinarum TaxID=2992147 RepID=A0ABT3J1U5_9RHOB|nr:cupin domain-containing protein [Defluviimonas salinarum]MCW3781661.1 cupin domain-containing protein [Defluviimonas salinarum]
MNALSTPDSGTELFWFMNNLLAIPVSCEAGADRLSVVEQWAPHGDSPPLHIHHSEDEVFVVLKGRLRIQIDGTDVFLDAGGTVMAPKGKPHSFRVESAEGAHFLAITSGNDFERMIRAASRPADRPGLPDPAVPTEAMKAELTRICADHRIEIVGPPLH